MPLSWRKAEGGSEGERNSHQTLCWDLTSEETPVVSSCSLCTKPD